MSYTKGKWELDSQSGVINSCGKPLVNVFGATMYNYESNAAECMTNARLIVRAPAMLHALKKAQKALNICRYCEVLAEEIQELIAEVEHD